MSAAGAEGPLSAEVVATAERNIHLALDFPVTDRPGQVVVATTPLSVRVTSQFQITSVTAEFAGRSVPLAFERGTWRGALDFTGLPSGQVPVLVTATDAQGERARATIGFIHDGPPVVTLTEPGDSLLTLVGTTTFRLRATCDDDSPPSGCIDLYAYAHASGGGEPFVLAPGTDAIDRDVSLPGEGFYEVRVIGRDPHFIGDAARRSVYAVTSPRLAEVARARGRIVDATEDRLLVTPTADEIVTLSVRDRASGQERPVFQAGGGVVVDTALLVSGGVVFRTAPVPGGVGLEALWEWRGGEPVRLADGGFLATTLRLGGRRFAIWADGAGALVRHDLETGSRVTVATGGPFSGADVAANGDVVFSRDGEIHRYRDGVVTRLTDEIHHASGPVTDGTSVVYRIDSLCTACARWQEIAAVTPQGRVVLTPLSEVIVPGMLAQYAVAGGWIAFARPASDGTTQIWRRSPAGVEEQVTAFGASSAIVLVTPDGGVLLANRDRLYYAAPGGTAQDVAAAGSRYAAPVLVGGRPHLRIGSALFRVD